jgi:hypothetical protein
MFANLRWYVHASIHAYIHKYIQHTYTPTNNRYIHSGPAENVPKRQQAPQNPAKISRHILPPRMTTCASYKQSCRMQTDCNPKNKKPHTGALCWSIPCDRGPPQPWRLHTAEKTHFCHTLQSTENNTNHPTVRQVTKNKVKKNRAHYSGQRISGPRPRPGSARFRQLSGSRKCRIWYRTRRTPVEPIWACLRYMMIIRGNFARKYEKNARDPRGSETCT